MKFWSKIPSSFRRGTKRQLKLLVTSSALGITAAVVYYSNYYKDRVLLAKTTNATPGSGLSDFHQHLAAAFSSLPLPSNSKVLSAEESLYAELNIADYDQKRKDCNKIIKRYKVTYQRYFWFCEVENKTFFWLFVVILLWMLHRAYLKFLWKKYIQFDSIRKYS